MIRYRSLIRYRTYSLEEIIPYIGQDRKRFYGMLINMRGTRLNTLKNSQKCAYCGRVGNVFILEEHHNDCNPHFNLYHMRKNGGLLLMTRDHILPISRGGASNIENYQTLCTKCNGKKGNNITVKDFRKLNIVYYVKVFRRSVHYYIQDEKGMVLVNNRKFNCKIDNGYYLKGV